MFRFKRKYQDSMQYVYKIDTESNAYIVEIRLDDYDMMFHGWDASPSQNRELEPELLRFIEETGYEIPLKEKVEFYFYVLSDKEDEQKESDSIEAFRNNFKMAIFRIDRDLRQNMRKIATYALMSVLFLLMAYTLPVYFDQALLFRILTEGLFIGGWVFLWQAFSLFFFSSHELREKRKRYVKFVESRVYFKYVEEIKSSV